MYFTIVEFIYAANIQIILRIFNEIAMFFRRTFNIGYNGRGYVACGKEIVISLSNTHEAKFLNFVFKFYHKSQIKKFGGNRKCGEFASCDAPRITYRCYALGFIVNIVLRRLKYSKISSLVILDNFSLILSRC
jgi:hypothetical protein